LKQWKRRVVLRTIGDDENGRNPEAMVLTSVIPDPVSNVHNVRRLRSGLNSERFWQARLIHYARYAHFVCASSPSANAFLKIRIASVGGSGQK
jgi:hypothetical protein